MTVFYDLVRWEPWTKTPDVAATLHEQVIKHQIKLGRWENTVPTSITEIKFIPSKKVRRPHSDTEDSVSELSVGVDFTEPPDGYSLDAWFEDCRGKIVRAINDAS